LQVLGRLGEAVDVLRKAESLLPGDTDIALQLALCLHKLGELAAARVELERILAPDAASANLWFAYGLICQDSRDPIAAITAKASFGRAMRLRSNTFGRIAQALCAAPRGELWLDSERLRQSLAG
jgi:tetratricopeptide (TPR) repeat protein